jgi:hypothetical protein
MRYLAMALKARENGDAEHADRLVLHVSSLFGQAKVLETPTTSPPSAERPIQQQQQPQPNEPKTE